MIVTVVGCRRLEFKDDKGNEIKGNKIFVEYADTEDENLEGKVADSIFVSDKSGVVVPTFKFGEGYDFVYESVGIGQKARAKLKTILTKDGKKPVSLNSSAVTPF